MTLKEMAVEYRANIIPWQERASLLRKELRCCADPQERLTLQRRIRFVGQICREGRTMARIMETYYETRRESYGRNTTTGTLSHLSKQ